MSINPQFIPQEAKPLEQWRQDLLAAAELIRERGLCKGTLSDGGRVCAIGAIHVVVYGRPDICRPTLGDARDNNRSVLSPWARREDAAGKLASRIGTGHVGRWNDAPERTAAEVIAALEGAALS